uniref:Uncharacterized protein n=1 Tax=Anopheles coluzzii TaxID=1518534 RepID=A0A8W7PPB1_ANOCL
MRLNDPQIELVHDDPFMGYINEDTTADADGDEEQPQQLMDTDINDLDEEELDVGENSRTEAISSIQKVPTAPSARTVTVHASVEQSTTAITTGRQPYVIVLLME